MMTQKVIFKQLKGKATAISEFDWEICSLCKEGDIEREIGKAENLSAKTTEELSQQLKLKPDHRERLRLNMFGYKPSFRC